MDLGQGIIVVLSIQNFLFLAALIRTLRENNRLGEVLMNESMTIDQCEENWQRYYT